MTRHDFPLQVGIYPFAFELEPLSARSLAKYVYTEAPPGLMDKRPGEDELADRVRELLDPARPNQLGSLYRTIAMTMREVALAEPFAEPARGWGHWHERIEEVRSQGEVRHFEFLCSVLDGTHPALAAQPGCWTGPPGGPGHPARALERSPGILAVPPPKTPDRRWKLKRLANAHYWVVLAMLDARYAHAGIHEKLAFNLRECAKEHMKKGLGMIGKALAEEDAGIPFDSLPMGYRWGVDAKSALDSIVRALRQVAALDKAAVDEKLLPAMSVSLESLESLGIAADG